MSTVKDKKFTLSCSTGRETYYNQLAPKSFVVDMNGDVRFKNSHRKFAKLPLVTSQGTDGGEEYPSIAVEYTKDGRKFEEVVDSSNPLIPFFITGFVPLASSFDSLPIMGNVVLCEDKTTASVLWSIHDSVSPVRATEDLLDLGIDVDDFYEKYPRPFGFSELTTIPEDYKNIIQQGNMVNTVAYHGFMTQTGMVVYLQRIADNTSSRVRNHFARLMVEKLGNDSDVTAVMDFLQKFTTYNRANN